MIGTVIRLLAAMFTVLAGSALAPSGIAWASAAPAKIDSSFSFVTYDCGGQSPIRIVGEDSTITLNGSCGEVDVSGTANTLNLQTVAAILATSAGLRIWPVPSQWKWDCPWRILMESKWLVPSMTSGN